MSSRWRAPRRVSPTAPTGTRSSWCGAPDHREQLASAPPLEAEHRYEEHAEHDQAGPSHLALHAGQRIQPKTPLPERVPERGPPQRAEDDGEGVPETSGCEPLRRRDGHGTTASSSTRPSVSGTSRWPSSLAPTDGVESSRNGMTPGAHPPTNVPLRRSCADTR